MSYIPKVLFFDSGLGGLSVFREVYKLNPQCSYYYLFDHENFPYGVWDETALKNIVSQLLRKAIDLIKPDVLVVACNTASTVVLPSLRASFDIPIVGVVPAVKPAAKLSKKKIIGLLATPGTIARDYTEFLINEYAFDCKVIKVGTSSLVHLVEDYMMDSLDTPNDNFGNSTEFSQAQFAKLQEILDPFTSLPKNEQPDVVVLGCTHFPLIRNQIQQCVGPDIALVDSGTAIARRVQDVLLTLNAERARNHVTDTNEHPAEAGPKVMSFTGEEKLTNKEQLEFVCNAYGFPLCVSFDDLAKCITSWEAH